MSEARYTKVTICGVGLIGGSVALALRERGLAGVVTGWVRSDASADRLAPLGIVDEVCQDLADAIAGADIVLIAAPVDAIAPLVGEVARHAAPHTLITDAGSVKAGPVADSQSRLLQMRLSQGPSPSDGGPFFVGSHPMAGDHRTGPEAARADLFEGAVTVVTPSDATPASPTERTAEFWRSLGSQVLHLSPEEHDRLVAASSHAPHVVAAALAAATPDEALPLAATGWGDTTRVAAGSPELWREILLANREPVRAALSRVIEELEAYRGALDAGDSDRLQRLLEAAKAIKAKQETAARKQAD